jgi:hypothetical protein
MLGRRVNSGGDDAAERSEVGVGDGGRDRGGMDMMTRLREVRMTVQQGHAKSEVDGMERVVRDGNAGVVAEGKLRKMMMKLRRQE